VAKAKLPEPREYRQERPRAAILWNGVLIQELGIADLLQSVDMTLTLGRSRITRQHPQGKPKVGAARIVFLIPDEASARKMAQLLYLDARPMLTVGFGYEGAVSFWVGGAGVRTSPDPKQFSRVAGYKIETVEWKYESSVWTVTLNGMVGRTLRMLESRRPRVYTDKTLLDIAKGVANEFGVTLRIDGSLPVNSRIQQIAQHSGENTLNFLERISGLYGANLKLSTEVSTPGEMNPYAYEFVGEGSDGNEEKWATKQGQVRTILTIQSIINDFVDISKLEQSRDIVIGYCPHLSPEKFGFDGNAYRTKWDYLASSIQVSDERSAARVSVTQKINKEGAQEQAKVKEEALTLSLPAFRETNGQIDPNTIDVVALNTEQTSDTPSSALPVQTETRSAPPSTVSTKDMEASRVAGIVLSAGIKTKLTITLNPGAPFLDPGKIVRVIGTPTHDGVYGIEETQISLTKDGGLKTTHICRPLQKALPAKPQQAAVQEQLSNGSSQAGFSLSLPYFSTDASGAIDPNLIEVSSFEVPVDVPQPPTAEPVPDTAADESAGVSIDPGDTGFPADTGGF
jgi:hypothetical protein